MTETVGEAIAALRSDNKSHADALLQNAVAAGGANGEAYAYVADELTRNGFANEAIRLLTTAANTQTLATSPLLWASLANAYSSVGDLAQKNAAQNHAEQAAHAIAQTLDATPTNDADIRTAADKILELGAYEEDMSDVPNALLAFRAAYRLLPGEAQTCNALGYALADKGTAKTDLPEALTLTREAVTKSSDNPACLNSYGWALYKTGDLTGARRVLEEAVAGAPDDVSIYYHLGVVYAALGQSADAALELDRALALRPNFAEAEAAKKALGNGVLQPQAVK